MYSASNLKTKIANNYDKYLHALSDYEIDNFDAMY